MTHNSPWLKIGTGRNGSKVYGIWGKVLDGKRVYRAQRAPIIPQGDAGYYNLEAHLKLIGVKRDESVVTYTKVML